jgi:hypothetical protein
VQFNIGEQLCCCVLLMVCNRSQHSCCSFQGGHHSFCSHGSHMHPHSAGKHTGSALSMVSFVSRKIGAGMRVPHMTPL